MTITKKTRLLAKPPHIDRARTHQEGEIDNRLVETLPFSVYGSGFGTAGTLKASGVGADGRSKEVEIPAEAIESWTNGEIQVDGVGWEPLSDQLDLGKPIRISVVRGDVVSNELEATVYA